MKIPLAHHFKIIQRLLIFFTPIVASQTLVLVPVRADEPVVNLDTLDITSIAKASSEAISLPVAPGNKSRFNSSGLLAIDSLNKQPDELEVTTNANALSRAIANSAVSAGALSDIRFLSEPTFSASLPCNFGNLSVSLTTTASCNQSISQVEAQGNDFAAFVTSRGNIQGDFLVEAGETFSFNFLAYLGLESNPDSSLIREFNTSGEVSFNLFDFNSGSVIDSFLLSANLDTDDSSDFLLRPQTNQNLKFEIEDYALSFSLNKGSESAFALVAGNYSRLFEAQTRLILVGTNTNNVKATPEGSSILALLFFFGMFVGVGRKGIGMRNEG
jgi:hypothetical protein